MTRTSFSAGLVLAAVVLAAAPVGAQHGPAPEVTRLPADVIGMACSPTLVFENPVRSLLITGGQDGYTHHSYGPGALLTMNAGTDNGIEVGQEFFVRRPQSGRATRVSRENPATIRTAGWVRVYATEAKMSLVTISHACDSIDVGDYLEPFVLPQVGTPDADPPKPQKENYGQIMTGTDRRTIFAKDDFFLIDRGSAHGVTVGTRVMIFRDKRRTEAARRTAENDLPKGIVPEFLYEVGEAVAVDVKADTSTVRVLMAHDALLVGDYVALRK